jgi:hypothetical protein
MKIQRHFGSEVSYFNHNSLPDVVTTKTEITNFVTLFYTIRSGMYTAGFIQFPDLDVTVQFSLFFTNSNVDIHISFLQHDHATHIDYDIDTSNHDTAMQELFATVSIFLNDNYKFDIAPNIKYSMFKPV